MDDQLDLAGVVAAMLGLHAAELQAFDVPGPGAKDVTPALRTAGEIWNRIKPLAETGGPIAPEVEAMFTNPGIDTRLALAAKLRVVLGVERNLSSSLQELIERGPYASMLEREPFEAELTRMAWDVDSEPQPDRGRHLASLIILYVVVAVLSAVVGATKSVMGATVVIAIQALGSAIIAHQLRVRQAFWIALTGIIPASGLILFTALAGYRLVKHETSLVVVTYTRAARVAITVIAATPILVALVLTAISTPYMVQLFEFPVGATLLGITIGSLFLLAATVWLGFWRTGAQTGLTISVATIVITWSLFISLWLVMLGPAFVQVTKQFPEARQDPVRILLDVLSSR